jgi:hypothetical protein
MAVNQIPTPETDKMLAVKDNSQAVGEFIEWLGRNKMVIARYASKEDEWADEGEERVATGVKEGDLLPVYTSIEKMLAKYFKIDLDKVEKEKRQILEDLRSKT